MSEATFLNNPNYVRYVALLLQLHQVNAQEEGESAEAEALCDAMDKPWSQLNAAERERVGIISADSDMLIDDEVFRPVPPEQRTQDWLMPRLQEAASNGDWDAVLALLRNGPHYMPSDELAYQRSIAYRSLSHCEIALLFADHAYKNSVQRRDQPVPVAP